MHLQVYDEDAQTYISFDEAEERLAAASAAEAEATGQPAAA
jgi:hypothetical protein